MVESSRGSLTVGVDLGGTKILAGVVNAAHEILGRGKRPTPAREGGPAILATMVECVREALQQANASIDDVAGIGVGSPGPLDDEAGVILFSANLNVKQFALGPELSHAFGKPVLVRNDVRVGGYGEFRLGAGRGYRDLIAAFVGTGIGGCLIENGRVVEGHTRNAGELGHLVVKAGGPRCGCGARGCLEALSSRTAITRRIAKAVSRGQSSVLSNKVQSKQDRLKSKDLAAAFNANDPLVVREVHRAARHLGLALGGLINVFGPQVVIVGGGVTEALGQPWIDLIRVSASKQAIADPLGTVKIVQATLGDDAGIQGGALLARERFALH